MSLVKRSIESSIYNVISHGVQLVVVLVRSIMLARLLSPEIFGVYVFAQALISLPIALSRFGLGSAYVNRTPETDDPKASGVYLTFVTFTTLLFVVVPGIIASFFISEQQRLVLITLVVSTCLAHFIVPAQASATRRVAFRRPAAIELVIVLVTTVVSLALAQAGYGIWSLLSIDFLTAIIGVLGFYVIKPYWKPRFAWSANIARYYWNYGSQVVKAEVLGQLLNRVDDLWVGNMLGDISLGYYSRAYTFANYPRRVLAQPISTVAIGTYAEAKGNRPQLSRSFFQVNSLIIRLAFLVSGGLALAAPELVRLLLTEKWEPMISIFQIFLIFSMVDPLKMTVGKLFVAIGEPQILVRVRAIQFAILITGLVLLTGRYGVNGVAFASTLMTAVGMLILLWSARRFVDFSVRKLLAAPMLAVFAGYGVTLSLYRYLELDTLADFQSGLIKLIIFSGIYCLTMLIFEFRELKELVKFVMNQIGKKK